MKHSRLALAAAAVAALAGVTGCATASASGGSADLSVVGFSVLQNANQKVFSDFQKTSAGSNVQFKTSYGASGDQSRAVLAGLKADEVHLSLEPDVSKLADAGLVAKDWNQGANKGVLTQSVVVFVVRKGNPKHIKTWADLLKPGVQVLTPNPFTSGGARWNIMAAYGAQIEQGKTPAQATAYLGQLFKNVVAQDKSARDALQTFSSGKGDVLISYENEAIAAQKKGVSADYVVPDQTILIQNPIAVTTKANNAAKAKAFVSFLESDAGQRIFASKGYRPVNPALVDKSKFPTPPQLFTIDKLGGWPAVMKKYFDPANGVVAKIEQANGVSTGG
jgi:sulfate transport system substrate-binding protein